MKIGKACAIFMQIESDKYTVEEKGMAILEVLKMPTHNGVTKDSMLRVIKFLLYLAFNVPEQEAKICAGGCAKSYADPLNHCDGCEFQNNDPEAGEDG